MVAHVHCDPEQAAIGTIVIRLNYNGVCGLS